MSTHELNPLVLSLYRAAREHPVEIFQRSALEKVKSLLPFDSGWWGGGVITGTELTIHSLHLHDLSSEVPMEYAEFADQDPAKSAMLEKGSGTYRFHAPTVFKNGKSLGFRHVLKNNEIENFLVSGTLSQNNGFISWTALFRADPDQPYSDRDQRLMKALLPHLLEALAINRLLHLEQTIGHQRQFQLAIADSMGMLYHVETGFVALPCEEFGVSVTGRLPSRLIAALADTGQFVGNRVVIRGYWRADLLFLKARLRIPLDDLSAREVQIAQQLAQGHTHLEIAQTLHLAPSTVRSHMKHIYEKLGVHNKAQLIAAIHAG